MAWTKKRLLLWGKTYPEWSKKYYETVCTGAIDGETGDLVRIYPITMRHMETEIPTYTWIEAEIEKSPSDPRPESFRIQQQGIKALEHLDTDDAWRERSKWVLRAQNVFLSVNALEEAQATTKRSLGLIKPGKIKRISCRKKEEGDKEAWDKHRENAIKQRDLFVDEETKVKELIYMPVNYVATFTCADPACTTEHNMSILEWGVYALSRKEYARKGGAIPAEKSVIKALEERLDLATHDTHFFLGNTLAHPQNFMIVGLYNPPIKAQTTLGF